MKKNRLAASGLVLVILAFTASTYADDSSRAKELFLKAAKAFEEHDYAIACPAFAESFQLAARPATRFAMAECEFEAKHIATASTLYGDFLRMVENIESDAERAKHKERVKQAQTKQAELAKEIPYLTLVLAAAAPPNTAVTRDGVTLTAASLGIAVPVDPGEHVITVQAPGGELKEIRVTLERGGKTMQELEPPLPPDPDVHVVTRPAITTTDITAEEMRKSKFRTVAFVAGGIGVAGLIAGGVLGGLTMQKASVIEKHCTDITCFPEGFAATQDAQRLGLGSTIGFGVGIAGVATGAVMFVLSRRNQEKAQDKPNAQFDVLEASPMGAVFGMKGAF